MLCFVSYQHPCVDGSGICNSDGPTVNRLPISTPRRHRTRIVAKASDADAAAKDTTNTYHRGLPVDVTIPTNTKMVGYSQHPKTGHEMGKLLDCYDYESTTSSPMSEETALELRNKQSGHPAKNIGSPRRPQSSFPSRQPVSPPASSRRRPTTAPLRADIGPDSWDSLGFSSWPYF